MEFNINEIESKIRSKEYTLLGNGSGRKVYDIGSGYVVKYAKNAKGHAQNMAEYRISFSDDSSMLAKTIGASEDYRYIIAEKAEPTRGMKVIRDHFGVKSNDGLYRHEKMQNILNKYNFQAPDFGRASNWGVIEGRPVIIDYGLTGEIYRKYYLKERLGLLALIMIFFFRK